MIPTLAVVTDPLPEERRGEWLAPLEELLKPWSAKAVLAEDAGEIAALVAESNAELVIGSALEREAAEQLQAPLLPISFPIDNRLILTRGYAGYDGAVALLEDLGAAILD